ncbi:peptidase inhibitor family I36 protein [Kitasatospora sp. NPDC090091]|uniref:peptidase inhibitor family I36 protein n=1 Tax=Kitasatospora sp. NPDC090091 TaxID=3364081 RepID=UPI0037F4A6D6
MRFRTTALAVGAAALLTAGLAAAPATATTPRSATAVRQFDGGNCPAQSLCLYRDYNYTGGGIALQAGDEIPWLGDYGFNDRMSSWSNDTGVTCYWYTDAYFSGDEHDMKNRYRVNVLPSENDMASAVTCAY